MIFLCFPVISKDVGKTGCQGTRNQLQVWFVAQASTHVYLDPITIRRNQTFVDFMIERVMWIAPWEIWLPPAISRKSWTAIPKHVFSLIVVWGMLEGFWKPHERKPVSEIKNWIKHDLCFRKAWIWMLWRARKVTTIILYDRSRPWRSRFYCVYAYVYVCKYIYIYIWSFSSC